MKPWERYQSAPATDGPWSKYQSAPQDQAPQDSMVKALAQGFLGTGRLEGLNRYNALEEVGANFIPAATQLAAQPFITPVAAGAGLIGGPAVALATESALSGAAAGVGRVIQTGYQNIGATLGSGAEIKPIGEAFRGAAKEAGAGAIGTPIGKGLLAGARMAGPAMRAIGRWVVNNPLSRGVGNYTRDAAERLMSNAEEVVSRLGSKEEIGGRVYGAANKFKAAISENLDAAGEKYRQLVSDVLAKRADDTISVARLDDAVQVIDKEINLTTQEGNNTFRYFADRIRGLIPKDFTGPQGASADDIYRLQRDINTAMREGHSPAVIKKLGRLKTAIIELLNDEIPEIRQANVIYHGAAELAEGLSRIDNADDASRAILSRYRAPGSDTRQAILTATKELPAAQAALDELLNLNAAGQFSENLTTIPRTGFVPGLAATGSFLSAPLAVAAGVAGAPGLSPRLTALSVRAAQRAAPKIAVGAEYISNHPLAKLAAKGGTLKLGQLGQELLAKPRQGK